MNALPSYAIEPKLLSENPSLSSVSWKDHQAQALDLIARHADTKRIKHVVEVGGSISRNFHGRLPNAKFLNLDLVAGSGDIPTLICDVTKGVPLKTNSVDFIYTNNCFEHINAPWLAARELARILKPGGYIFVSAPWAWRYHPVPIDYWRYSPEALEYIFLPLSTVEKGFNTFYRRHDSRGKFPNKMDSVPVDELGGWRENWLSFYFGTKVTPSPVPAMEKIEGILGRLGIRKDPRRWPSINTNAA